MYPSVGIGLRIVRTPFRIATAPLLNEIDGVFREETLKVRKRECVCVKERLICLYFVPPIINQI